MSAMEKRAFVMIAVLIFVLTGCAGQTEPPDSQTPEAEYRYFITDQDIEKMPYRLSGEKDGWTVECVVREIQADEKSVIIEMLERRLELAENSHESGEMDDKQFRPLKESLEKKIQDVTNGDLYKSEVFGRYRGEKLSETGKGIIYFSIMDSDGTEMVSGGVDLRSVTGPWYTAYNLKDGEYFSNAVIPPIEGGSFVMTFNGREVVIPLEIDVNCDTK